MKYTTGEKQMTDCLWEKMMAQCAVVHRSNYQPKVEAWNLVNQSPPYLFNNTALSLRMHLLNCRIQLTVITKDCIKIKQYMNISHPSSSIYWKKWPVILTSIRIENKYSWWNRVINELPFLGEKMTTSFDCFLLFINLREPNTASMHNMVRIFSKLI